MHKKRLGFVSCSLLALILLGFLWDGAEKFHHGVWKESHIQAIKNEDSKVEDLQYQTSVQSGKNIDNGFHIHINLDQLEMYVYNDDELLKTYPVSGGKPDTPSPIGIWKIINKDTWGEGFGGSWLGLNVPWGLYGIHGTIEPWFVGRSNSSEGCIRMKNTDVKQLYELVPYGTTVTIVYENIPFRTMRHGDVGADVIGAEKALKKLEYYSGGTDGVFGDTLAASVRRFQKDNRLHVTGRINTSTYNLIMEYYNESQKME